MVQHQQNQTIFTQSGIIPQNVQVLSPCPHTSNGGASGPTSPVQVVPQAMSPTGQDMRNSGIQDLKIQNAKPILMTRTEGASTFCTPTGVSNATNPKKIILQSIAQPSNIILTNNGQQILLQATNQG